MILCCGEALIDMLPRRTTEGEEAYAPHAGGAVFNTAIALGRLGAKVGFFSGLSRDLFGETLAGALGESGVDTSLAARSDRPTTLAFVRLVDGQASYAFYDENTAGRMLSAADLPDIPESVSALFFGGISLAVEPCAAAYEALMMRAGPRRVTMLDPNIRPSFIKDEAAYRARIDRMIARADIVKLSDEDLAWLVAEGDPTDRARSILAKGPRILFVTEGARGATAYRGDDEIFVAAPRAEVVDTVGAGDTFNAGVLAALDSQGALDPKGIATADDETLRAALSLGTRAAAVTVSRAGANPPWSREL